MDRMIFAWLIVEQAQLETLSCGGSNTNTKPQLCAFPYCIQCCPWFIEYLHTSPRKQREVVFLNTFMSGRVQLLNKYPSTFRIIHTLFQSISTNLKCVLLHRVHFGQCCSKSHEPVIIILIFRLDTRPKFPQHLAPNECMHTKNAHDQE